MRVILAQPRGFCAGVVRAIEIVERSLERHGAPVYVRHEIVHNKAVVDSLKAKGAVFVEELDEVPARAVTIFSAHGVGQTVEANAEARGLHVLNATCPLVTKVHVQGRQYAASGRVVILIGHAGHPEVEGTMGQIEGRVLLVQDEREAELLDLPNDTPVAYVTQTTLSVDDTRGVIAALQRRFTDIIGPDIRDICYATQIAKARCVSFANKSMCCWWSVRTIARTRIVCAKSVQKSVFPAICWPMVPNSIRPGCATPMWSASQPAPRLRKPWSSM